MFSNQTDRFPAIIGLILIITLALGCELLGHDRSPIDDVQSQQQVWQTLNSGSYTYTLFRSCFCPKAGKYRITVVDDEVTSVVGIEPVLPNVDPDEFGMDVTIDGIFEYLKDAYRTNADVVNVTWSENGYPRRIYIDFIKEAVDDEMTLELSDVALPFDEPIRITTAL